MGLVYLITGLPRLRRDESAPMSRDVFVERCLDQLRDNSLAEMKRLIRIESVEETIRLSLNAQLAEPSVRVRDLQDKLLHERKCALDLEELPAWAREPMAQHQLLRRHYYELTRESKTPFLRKWAHFQVDLREIKTALLCRQIGMSRKEFLQQMQGSFDASSPLMIRNWDEPRLGLGNRFVWLSTVIEALSNDDMLAGETALIDVQWKHIDALPVPDLFSVETVMAYYLQLRLLERKDSWNREHGKSILDYILNIDLGDNIGIDSVGHEQAASHGAP
ncbi:MAG TPA: hypothetical protein DCQ06_09095 [Myxococcales bacterium]|nr:hypothetical protein [Myxococcales bacterium]HAN31737.1 hypothetical protein [Myxococcales bacterium]